MNIIKLIVLIVLSYNITSVFAADFFYSNIDNIAEYDDDRDLTIRRNINKSTLTFYYKDKKLPIKYRNKLSPTDGGPFITIQEKNIICTEVVQNASSKGQNIRNIYMIYNKAKVIAFTTKKATINCESEIKEIKTKKPI